MKSFLIGLLSIMMLSALFTSCSTTQNTNTTATTVATENESSTAETQTAEKTYKDNYNGLVEYMADKGYIVNDDKSKREMNADVIGATKGDRFTKDGIMIELYDFSKADSTNDVIKEIKEKGYFTIYDAQVEAFLTDSEKYVMVYVDSKIVEGQENDASKKKASAVEDFKNFNK